MAEYRVGLVGTGVRRREDGSVRFGMNAQHASGYQRLGDTCQLVACADIAEDNARTFAERFDISRTYVDYREMLEKENLDIVSISTWPRLHAQMTIDCARAGVRAIHCEKPMANTWGDARKMARVCAENGVQLTFNHQRRFGKPARKAKAMLDEGQIGELARLEFGRFNLCDYGTHQFDMCNYFNDQAPVEWVIGQIDYRSERRVFGEHQENQALVMWRYGNGVLGLCATSDSGGLMGAHDRMIGTDGIIEIEPSGEAMPVLRVLRKGDADWETVDTEGESHHGPGFVERAIADILHHLEEGTTSELCAENALQATEIIFAAWESSRRRGRVDLPLQIEDNPLASMVESGELSPDPRE